MLGGGVRQGGVLAAAGLIALDRVDRLADDHRRARTLADGTLRRFEESGVRASAMSGQVRLMTHADVSDADIAAALDRIGPVETGRSAYAPAQRGLTTGAGRAPVRPGGR
jgi:threonine aldolase